MSPNFASLSCSFILDEGISFIRHFCSSITVLRFLFFLYVHDKPLQLFYLNFYDGHKNKVIQYIAFVGTLNINRIFKIFGSGISENRD